MAAQRQWIHLQKQLVPKQQPAAATDNRYSRNVLRRHKEAIEAALKRGHLKVLNRQLILDSQLRTEGCAAPSELEYVQRISLGRCHVQALEDFDLISCVRLRICNLELCYISDISAFYGCVNLLKMDMTNNQISILPPRDFWSSLASLRVLYLCENAISGKANLARLNGCPQLHVLTLNNTPLSFIKNYRHHVVNSIMSLRALDYHVISDEEIIENLHLEEPFQPLSDTFRLDLYRSFPVGTSLKDEVRGVYRLLLAVDRVMARYSPVVIIQRWIRGWLLRKALMKSGDPKVKAMVARRLGRAIGTTRGERYSSSKEMPPQQLSNFSPTRKTIAAQVPSSSSSRPLKTQKANNKRSSTPPPPPTTPMRRRNDPLSRSVETHVLGVDEGSSQLRYSMHINLNKLQQAVEMAEGSEQDGTSSTFKRAFVKNRPIATRDKQGLTKKPGEVEAKSLKKFATCEQDEATLDEGDDKNRCTDDMELYGQMAEVLSHDQLPNLTASKKEDGKALRAEEKEISDKVAKLRRPPLQPIREVRPKPIGKEQHSFTRAYATMTLSALKSIEKVHEARRKGEELIRKANLVAKIKQERVVRRTKIEEHQRSLRENILEWKTDELQRLEEAKIKQRERHEMEVMKRVEVHDEQVHSVQKQYEEQEFASEFSRQNTLVSSALSKEDRKASQDCMQSKTKERVQQARTLSMEQQELVKRYMESRKAQLIREGAEIKRELDIKTLEAVSQRLMDAKRKVAKETARKQAAREAIAEVKRELRLGPQGPGEQRPPARGSAVRRESDEDVRQRREERLEAFAKKQSEYSSPAHVKKMSFEAHKSWQRGVEALESADKKGSHHFPVLPATSRSAMMYDMMAPGSILTSQDISPLTSSDAHIDNSATSSMLISNYQTVR